MAWSALVILYFRMLHGMVVPGLISGVVATLPMTFFMGRLLRRLPRDQQEPLQPAQVTMGVADLVGVEDQLDERQRENLVLLFHFGYGGLTGAAFGSLSERLPGNTAAKGAGFALAVWALSYLGVLPATRLFPAATREPRQRQIMLIAAHVVWGAFTGTVGEYLANEARRSFTPARPKRPARRGSSPWSLRAS